jgi:hypothetical protein
MMGLKIFRAGKISAVGDNSLNVCYRVFIPLYLQGTAAEL